MKKLILITILSLFSVALLTAQDKRGLDPEMFEKIKAEKISYFTGKLDLTPTEAQAFWPIYNEYEKKRFDLQRKIHSFERMPEEKMATLSDPEIEKLINNYIESFEMEGDLRREYHKKFVKVLPMKKILLMYRTENDFRSHLIREYKKGRNNDQK